MKTEINDNILSLIDKTPDSLMFGIAEHIKARKVCLLGSTCKTLCLSINF
jgi:hypothetical protein